MSKECTKGAVLHASEQEVMKLASNVNNAIHHIARLRSSRPYDGRRVTLTERRGGWRYQGIIGTCTRRSEDGKLMTIVVDHDPDSYWPVGMEILADIDDDTVPHFGFPIGLGSRAPEEHAAAYDPTPGKCRIA
jgi:hypothetical protein